MISFDSVSFQYNQSETSFILKEVSFCLKKGFINGIIGNNGSGKTTAARIIAGLIRKNSGKVEIDGIDIEKLEIGINSPKLISGIVFQNPDNQIVGTTVGEDLAFGLENLCLQTDEIHKKVKQTASEFGFYNDLNKPTNELSGGQKQLLCIAGVLIMEPSWVIFDEPTSHLDPWGRKNFWELIRSIARKGKTGIAVISQLPGDLCEFDRVTVFNKGHIEFDDEISKYELPKFQDYL